MVKVDIVASTNDDVVVTPNEGFVVVRVEGELVEIGR